jgi:hypothetical protein
MGRKILRDMINATNRTADAYMYIGLYSNALDHAKSIRSVYMPLFANFATNVKRRNIFN